MKIKKTLRLIVLILMICLACVLPIPIAFRQKDNLPKNLIEQVEQKDKEDESDIRKDIF